MLPPAARQTPTSTQRGSFVFLLCRCWRINTWYHKRFFGKDNDALQQEWKADSVWGNFPGGFLDDHDRSSLQGAFLHKAIREHAAGNFKEGVFLVKAALNAGWFRPAFALPMAFVRDAIVFLDEAGEPMPKPSVHPYVLVYLGPDSAAFLQEAAKELCFVPGINMFCGV